MNDKITKEMLTGFEAKTRLYGHHGNGVNLSIDIITHPIRKVIWFVLNDNRMDVYTGPDLDTAIEIYNNILEDISNNNH